VIRIRGRRLKVKKEGQGVMYETMGSQREGLGLQKKHGPLPKGGNFQHKRMKHGRSWGLRLKLQSGEIRR